MQAMPKSRGKTESPEKEVAVLGAALAGELSDDFSDSEQSMGSSGDDEPQGLFSNFVLQDGELTDEQFNQLNESLGNVGQAHILAYFDELSPVEKAALLAQLGMIDPVAANETYDSSMTRDDESDASEVMAAGASASIVSLNKPDYSDEAA